MTSAQATAEVFWTAFLGMTAKERQAFLQRLVAEPRLREDLLDAALIEERTGEPTRPLEQVLARSRPKKTPRTR